MRSLLAFIALCAVASKFGSHAAQYYAEQRVLAELRKTGASFHVHESKPGPPVDEWAALGKVGAFNVAGSLAIFL
jgi:hypothetical protein